MDEGIKRLSRGLRRLWFYFNWSANPPERLYVTLGEYYAAKNGAAEDLGSEFGMVDEALHFRSVPVEIGTDEQVSHQRSARPEHKRAQADIDAEFAGVA